MADNQTLLGVNNIPGSVRTGVMDNLVGNTKDIMQNVGDTMQRNPKYLLGMGFVGLILAVLANDKINTISSRPPQDQDGLVIWIVVNWIGILMVLITIIMTVIMLTTRRLNLNAPAP